MEMTRFVVRLGGDNKADVIPHNAQDVDDSLGHSRARQSTPKEVYNFAANKNTNNETG